MPDVAKALLGDPEKRTAREWRYGDKGSLKINLEAGTWYSFEAGKGGGVLDLVQWELQADQHGAIKWLIRKGFLPEQAAHSRAMASQSRPDENAPKSPDGDNSEKAATLVSNLRTRAVSAEGTPARAYLAANCGCRRMQDQHARSR